MLRAKNQSAPEERVIHIHNNVNLTKILCLKLIGEIDRLNDFFSHYGGGQSNHKVPYNFTL